MRLDPKCAGGRILSALVWAAVASAACRPSRDAGASSPGLGSDEEATRIAGKLERGPLARYDAPTEAQEFFAAKRLAPGETSLPVERYLRAVEEMRGMRRYSTATRTTAPAPADLPPGDAADADVQAMPAFGVWSPLGPGNVGGRTRALIIDPGSANVMYAAAASGGVWKTTDGGGSWAPLDDLMANLAVNALAMDPGNSQVLYAGTGEGYFNIDTVRGAGIFKSTNGGASWTRLASTDTSDFHYVNDIVVSPNNGQRVYAATRSGVWRSTNAGSSWTRVLTTPLTAGCLDLAIRPGVSNDFMFASCGSFTQATVYRNTSAGGAGAWTAVLSETGMGRTSLAIAPSNDSVVYALSASIAAGSYDNGLHAVFRSTDTGSTWTARVRNSDPVKLNTVLLSNTVIAFLSECGAGTSQFFNQGWYDNVIAVDPADANRVWAGGIDLFRSDNGGTSWGLASHWWANDANPRLVHADQHALAFHPGYNGTSNQTLFVGNDGGVYRTLNARATTATGATAPCNSTNGSVFWSKLNNSYAVTQFYDGVPYPGGSTYFGGTQDNGTVRGNDGGGPNAWAEILGGDGGSVAIDPSNANVLYAENTGLSIQKSTNGGSSFASATNGISDPGFQFIAPFLMDPSQPQRLWAGGWYLWRTVNGASSWSRASAITAGVGSVSAIAVAPSQPAYVLAGMSDGYIHRTTNGLASGSGTNWPVTQPRSGYVSSLAFDPDEETIAYATYSSFGGSHVWKSTNAGASWTAIDGSGATGIPDIPAHVIVVDPFDTARLYVGTDLGVFVSLDGGGTWLVENTGFANVVTEALIAEGSDLFAFTHGRGAFRVALTSAAPDLTVTKSDNLDPVTAGQALSYTVSVSNVGNNPATNVTLTDTLPNGVSFVSSTPGGPTCTHSAGVVTCGLGTFAPAVSANVTINVLVASGTTGTLVNTATATMTETEPTPANNTATETTAVVQVADLSVTKSDSPDPVNPLQVVTYSLSIANAGPSAASNVTVVDTLPGAVTFSSASAGCAHASGVVTCAVGTLAAGGNTMRSIQATVNASALGMLSNSATVSSSASDPVSGDNTSVAATTVVPLSDLTVNQSDVPDPVRPLEPLIYTVTVGNSGPSTATGVVLTETLSPDVTFVSATPGSPTCTESAGVVTCQLGSLASGATAPVSISVTVVGAASGSLTSTASVAASETDPSPGNNSEAEVTTVEPVADLSVTKVDSADPVDPGDPLTYTLTVTNNGPSTATSVTLTDVLPLGVSFVSSTPGSPTCAESSGTFTCNLGSLAASASTVVTVTATVGTVTTLANTAQAAATELDPVPGNNASTATTAVLLGIGNELLHGSSLIGDLRVQPGPLADEDWYHLGQKPYSSWEIRVDATSGDIGPSLLVERMDYDLTGVLQTSVPVSAGLGYARSLRIENATASPVNEQLIRVRSAGCTTDCGPDDVYRIEALETTQFIPRFNNSASQFTVLLLQNPSALVVDGNLWFWSTSGELLASEAFSLPPHGTLVLNAASLLPGASGSVSITHNAPYGALVGKAVALEPATGFTFDSPMVSKPR